MRKQIMLAVIGLLFSYQVHAKSPIISNWDILIEALIQVESEGNRFAVGTSNDVGVLQITPIYVKEVNRILKSEVYSLNERTDISKSIEMFEVYQSHYNPERCIRKAIKLHNPGAGEWYTDKVLTQIKRISTEKIFNLELLAYNIIKFN